MTDPVTRPPATDEVPQDASAASPQAVAALHWPGLQARSDIAAGV